MGPGASRRGGVWRTTPAEVPPPEVFPPGPFDTPGSPVDPAQAPWLLTLAVIGEVRAGSSAPARTGTGRLRCVVCTSFHHLTVCFHGRLSPITLRLTRPVGAWDNSCAIRGLRLAAYGTQRYTPGYLPAEGKGEAGGPASPSPLSQWSRFSIFDRREGLSPGDPSRSCPMSRSHTTYVP